MSRGRDLTSALFREDSIVGVAFAYLGDQKLFAEQVHVGYKVLRGLLLDLTRLLVARELQLAHLPR
jgi:hypothetical protein